MPVKVRDILAKKAQEVASVSQDATVAEAAHLMNQRRIGALVVTSGPRVVGIFTERDILCRVVAERRAVMTTRRMRHLPVVDDNRLVGMLSIGDIMAQQVAAQQETIKYLNEYLYGPTR